MDPSPAHQPQTRRRLLEAGVGLAAALILPLPGAAAATGAAGGDRAILTGLLRTELLSIALVEHVLAGGHLAPAAERLTHRILLQERVHARRIRGELRVWGPKMPPPPRDPTEIDRQLAAHHVARKLGDIHGDRDALDLLLAMESIAEGGFYAAMSKLTAPLLLSLSARLLASEAQHEAVLGALRGPKDADRATPYAFVEGTV